jgi:hypothetical protein
MEDGETRQETVPQDARNLEDFLNTLDRRTYRRHGVAREGGDLLVSPQALAEWFAERGLLAPGTRIGEDDLAAAVALRSALRAAAGEAFVEDAAARSAQAVLADFPLHLAPDPDGELRLVAAAHDAHRAVAPIVEAVVRCVVAGHWKRLRICAASDCGWAFYDGSRNGGARWCSMAVCGNREKTRAYRRRRRQSP